MDHFPPVLNPHNAIIVPYLGGVWDHGSFESFYDRHDIDIQAIQQGHFSSPSDKKPAAALFQAWFLFGLIENVVQFRVQQDDFICNDQDGNRRITTAKLKEYLLRWKTEHDAAKGNAEALEMRKSKTLDCLHKSFKIWSDFEDIDDFLGPEAALGILIFAQTIEFAAECFSTNPRKEDWEEWISIEDLPWRRLRRSQFLIDKMLEDGWCPSRLEPMFRHTSVSTVYFTSTSGKPQPLNHRKAGCLASDRACRLTNISMYDYKTRHVHKDCSCDFIGPDMEAVCQIIEEGGIPILFGHTIGDKMSLQVTRQRKDTHYTAVSHVYVDILFIDQRRLILKQLG